MDKLEAFKMMKPAAKLAGVTGEELKALIEYVKKQLKYEKTFK